MNLYEFMRGFFPPPFALLSSLVFIYISFHPLLFFHVFFQIFPFFVGTLTVLLLLLLSLGGWKKKLYKHPNKFTATFLMPVANHSNILYDNDKARTRGRRARREKRKQEGGG